MKCRNSTAPDRRGMASPLLCCATFFLHRKLSYIFDAPKADRSAFGFFLLIARINSDMELDGFI